MAKKIEANRKEGAIQIVTDLEAARHAIPGHSNFATINVNEMECIIDFWYSDISVARIDFDAGKAESLARLVARVAMPTNKARAFFNEANRVIEAYLERLAQIAEKKEE